MVLPLSALFIIKALSSLCLVNALHSAIVRLVPGFCSYERLLIRSLIMSNVDSNVLLEVLSA